MKTYLHQLCVGAGCSLEDLPGAMNDRDGWRERERERERELRKSALSAQINDDDNGDDDDDENKYFPWYSRKLLLNTYEYANHVAFLYNVRVIISSYIIPNTQFCRYVPFYMK